MTTFECVIAKSYTIGFTQTPWTIQPFNSMNNRDISMCTYNFCANVITVFGGGFCITIFIIITKRHQTRNDARPMSRVSNPKLLYIRFAKVHQFLDTNKLGKALCTLRVWKKRKKRENVDVLTKDDTICSENLFRYRCTVANRAYLTKLQFRNAAVVAIPLSDSFVFCSKLKIENSMPCL